MKLLSWNIQHGGASRGTGIVSAIAAHDPDVVFLTEFRTKPGEVIRKELESWGGA